MSTRRPSSEPAVPPEDETTLPEEWNPDATPYVEGYDVAPDTVPPMVGVGVPAVVAVVPTRNPGPWLETTLAALAAQEYANLTTLVVDAGSVSDPTERVADVLPGAFVKRVPRGTFATAANAALGTIEGAAFFLFLHDDAELGAGAVQAMVEEAFRSNAGVVGAKLVDWDHPDHLRSMGGSVDKFGFSWPIAEPGELDQAQHDAVREAFVVSTAAMLVRADLFADLEGFATDIDGSGEDLDLCWRARIAGARTVVMPAAVVRHRERSELGDPTGRAAHLALRHQARVVLACYSPLTLLRVVPQAVVLAFLDMVAALVRGRVSAARDIGAALVWNVGHLPRTLAMRGRIKRTRRTSDGEIRRLQIKGSARLIGVIRQFTSSERTMGEAIAAAARNRNAADEGPAPTFWAAGAFLVAAFVLLFGSRALLVDGIPRIRQFTGLGSPTALLAEWWSGWRTPGLGSASAAPTLALVARVATWLTFGQAGLARTLLILMPLPLGAAAAWRLFRGCASYPARAAALLGYLVNPLPYNAISEGRWQALVAYAAAPSLVGRIARAGGWAPFDAAEPAPGSVQRQIVGLGIVVAAATTVAPVVALLTLAVALVVIVPMSVSGRDGNPLRAVTVTAGGLALSAVLHLPWTLSVLGASNRWAVLTGSDPSRTTPPSLSRAIMFDTGSHGSIVTVGLVAAVGVALLIASRERFRWASVAASAILLSLLSVVLAGRLAPSVALPPAEVLLSLAAAGVVLGFPLGVEAFRSDVVGGAFGWKQLLSVLAVLGVLAGSAPLVVDFLDGRWLAPRSDLAQALSPIRADVAVPGTRTLWLGDADALGTAGWVLADGTKFALTDGVSLDSSDLFPQEPGPGERALRTELRDAADGSTTRLGAALAAYGVRYVAVVERLAPLPYGRTRFPMDPALAEQLNLQFDLRRIDVNPGVVVYENLAALPVRGTTSAEEAADLASAGAASRLVEDRPQVAAWQVGGDPPTDLRGDVPADRSVLVLSALDDGWTFEVDGREVARKPLFGWAARFDGTRAGGAASLSYSASAGMVILHLIQLALLVSLPWLRRRRVSESRARFVRTRGLRGARSGSADVSTIEEVDA